MSPSKRTSPPAIVTDVRAASRVLVRELGLLEKHCPASTLTFPECHALLELEAQSGLTGAEIAERLGIDKSLVSRALGALARKKAVRVQADRTDARRRTVEITPTGKRLLARVHANANSLVSESLRWLDDSGQAQVLAGLAAYGKALRKRRLRSEFSIRPIQRRDDPSMAAIIRKVMTEHGASGEGFAIHDAEVDKMSKAYGTTGKRYFVVTRGRRVVGGGGIAPLEGAESGVCELRKMYFLPEARGLGLGADTLERCLHAAADLGYARCYLETLNSMQRARALYEAFGFERLCGPLGATGHFGCDAWYALDLRRGRARISSESNAGGSRTDAT